VGDLLRFGEALRGHLLLSPTATATLFEGRVEMAGRPGARYGYGFTVQEQGAIVGHGGGAPGIGSMLDIYLDRPLLTALMTNYDPWDMQPVAERLRQLCAAIS
jgi:CubicO group peptidase (beta-lactamase class C family)